MSTETIDQIHLDYLKKIKFEKRLKFLKKKLKNKRLVIYAVGSFFNTICTKYDLSDLNIVAVSDKSFSNVKTGDLLYGYQKCLLSQIASYEPDYILIGSLKFISIIEDLEKYFDNSIKIRPLIKKPLLDLWQEVCEVTR